MIHRFQKRYGNYIEKIPGQERLAYSMSDNADLYDLTEWAARGGYPGAVIRFHDLETGAVYEPFEKKRNVTYAAPAFSEDFYYFLQGDCDEKQVTLYRYRPEEDPEAVAAFRMDEVDLYNLRLIGDPLYVISQNDTFRCYYPEAFSFALQPNETVCFIDGEKAFVEAWIEEGWDEEKDCAGEDYAFYHKVLVKDRSGNTVFEELGYLHQAADGSWWIA